MSFRPFQFYYSVRQVWYDYTSFFQRREYAIGVVVGVLVFFAWAIRAIFR